MKRIFVLAASKEDYEKCVEEHLIPGLSRYHDISFTRHGDEWRSPKYQINRATKEDIKGVNEYMLVKFGNFYEYEGYREIIALYDLMERNKK